MKARRRRRRWVGICEYGPVLIIPCCTELAHLYSFARTRSRLTWLQSIWVIIILLLKQISLTVNRPNGGSVNLPVSQCPIYKPMNIKYAPVIEKRVSTLLWLTFQTVNKQEAITGRSNRVHMSSWQTLVSPGTLFSNFLTRQNKQSWSQLIPGRGKIHASNVNPSWADFYKNTVAAMLAN